MKRIELTYLLFTVAIAAVIAGCSQIESVDVNPNIDESTDSKVISFNNSSVEGTRAIVNETCAAVGTIGVYSYMHSASEVEATYGTVKGSWYYLASPEQNNTPSVIYPYFTDDTSSQLTVSYYGEEDDTSGNAGVWSYGWTQYWPSDTDTKLTFYAFAPQGRINRVYNSDRGIHDFNHTLAASAVENYDLMWADVQYDMTHETAGANGEVDITLKHALTRITLMARVMVDAITDASIDGFDYTNKYNYERYGINGVTFYGVAGQADVVYYDDDDDWDGVPRWALPTTDNINRIDLTATQGKTLVEHDNNLNANNTGEVTGENYGQIRKIDIAQYKYEQIAGTPDESTFTNVMYVDEDDNTYSIFTMPQDFTTDSPNATARVRLRHYDNYMIPATEYVGVRPLFTGLSDENILAFATKPVKHLSTKYAYTATQKNDPYLFGIQFLDQWEEGAYALNSSYNDDTATLHYKIMVCYDAAGTLYDVSDIKASDGNKFTNVEYFVVKDLDGTIYETEDIDIKPIFPTTGWEAGDWFTLLVTFDATEGANLTIPLSVEARVRDWVDQDVEVELDEQLIVYCDQLTISSNDNSVVFYTNAPSTEITATSTSCTVGGVAKSSSAVNGVYTCTIAVSDLPSNGSITINVDIPHNGMTVTKVFTLEIV